MATGNVSSVLKDVVAYVDVWSSDKTANYSRPFIQQLQEMGAQVTKTFTKQVTHVVFNNGHPAAWTKAKKNNVNLVSVLWVGRCYDEAVQVDEKLFPALNETNPVLMKKKHRCMQPKDSPERTPDSDKRLKKKLDKMMKEIVPLEPLVTDISPIIIDEKNGIIYNPGFKPSDYMARRLKEMKDKHEDTSPTASQTMESLSALKPSLGSSPSIFKFPYQLSDDESSASVAEAGCSPAKEEVRTLPGVSNQCLEPLRKEESKKPWMSPCNEVIRHTSISSLKFPDFEENKDDNNQKRSRRVSRRMSIKRNCTEANHFKHLSEILEPGTSDNKNTSKKESRRSTVKSPSSNSEDHKPSSTSREHDHTEEKQKTIGEEMEPKKQTFPKNVKSSVTVRTPDVMDDSHEEREDQTGKSWMSPYNVMFRQTSLSSLKCAKFEESEDKKKKSRRVSVKSNSTKKRLNFYETSGTSDSKKQKEKESRGSKIHSQCSPLKDHKPSIIKSEGTEQQKETHFFLKNIKSSSVTNLFRDTAAGLSKDTVSPLSKKELTKPKQTPIYSELVHPLPSASHKTVSCSTDGDNVFEDYFSSTDSKQRSKKPVSLGLTVQDLQFPFVLDSVSKKRKPRSTERSSSETNSSQTKKNEECTILFNHHDGKCTSERHSQLDNKQLLSDQDIFRADLTQLTKRKRQSALPFTSICVTTSQRQRLSLSVEPTKLQEIDAASETHKESDACFRGCTLTNRGNEDSLMTEVTEAASEEQTKQDTTSLHDMVNKLKVERTLVMTSMPTEKQNTVVQVVKALGGFSLVDQVCESTTHVVSGGHRRTVNVLLGIARGCWILSFEWILWSLEKRHWIPEEPYELSDQFPAAQICRLQRHLSAGEHQQDLFQDQPAMFVSLHSQPPTQCLIELIQLCGGTICKTVRQAGICIGKHSGRRPEGSKILSEQWVLDSITHLKQLPYADYSLE